jgi:sulfoxide reductase catalytic subunit YedY
MLIRRRRGWEIAEALATPEAVFLDRRALIAAAGLGMLGAIRSAASAETDPTIDLYPAQRNSKYAIDRPITPEAVNTTYNNFIEFGAQRNVWRAAQALKTRPWQVTFDGMVERTFTLGIDELIRRMTLEERLYRHRCVEPWSMTVPWTGFPLAALVALVRPLGSAKYVRFESFNDAGMASGQSQFWYPWPYADGLTLAEATHELAFMVTGAYGRPLGKSMGAPLRLHVPWKYGFKSVKSVARITFTDERPVGFWTTIAPDEYGFWANVNPEVPHPRWSQAVERDIATGQMVDTKPYNGYGQFVAPLYTGLVAEALYM